MSGRTRMICGGISLVLFGWMIWLFCVGPEFGFERESGGPALTARCEPMLWGWGVSWGGTPSAGEITGDSHRGYDIVEGELPGAGDQIPEERRLAQIRETRSRLAGFCDRARTGQAGLIALLAVPATLLALAAVVRRRPAPGN